MSFEQLLTEDKGATRVITINRPKQLNALNKAVIGELNRAFTEADQDDSIRSVIVTGSGEKAFVAGADIKEFSSFNVNEGKELSAEGHRILFDHVEQLQTPVIAAINGFALGGGLELALSAHFRIASDNARVGLPEVTLGLIPGYGGTQRLARLVGTGKANEMIFTGGMIKAEEALSWGLVNKVVPQAELIETCLGICEKINANSPTAISAAIRSVNAGFEPLSPGLKAEIDEFGNCFGTPDFKEGVDAFLNKRKPDFKGKTS